LRNWIVFASLLVISCNPGESADPPARVPRGSLSLVLRTSGQYRWVVAHNHGVDLYAQAGTPLVAERDLLAGAASKALAHDLALLQQRWSGADVDVFVFAESSALAKIVHKKTNGFVQPGENTVLLVYDQRRPPVLRHELMHVVLNHSWGVAGREKDWLSEGIATWSTGGCQGHTFLQIAAELNRRSPLPRLQSLARDFRTFGELTAFVQAASVVEFLAREDGVDALRQVWQSHAAAESPLGLRGDRIEKRWRRALENTVPAVLYRETVEREGCEPSLQ
jgi:hypothetical protein